MSRLGRRPQEGARYPSGKLKPVEFRSEGFSPLVIKRVVAMAARKAVDPRYGSVVGVLHLEGKITAQQFSAGCAYARLRGRYDHVIDAAGRMTLSPDYGEARQISQSGKTMKDKEARRIRLEHDRMLASLEDKWPAGTVVDGETPHSRARRVAFILDRVLVEDLLPCWSEMPVLTTGLQMLVRHFGVDG